MGEKKVVAGFEGGGEDITWSFGSTRGKVGYGKRVAHSPMEGEGKAAVRGLSDGRNGYSECSDGPWCGRAEHRRTAAAMATLSSNASEGKGNPGFHSPVKTEERKWENDRPIGRWVEGRQRGRLLGDWGYCAYVVRASGWCAGGQKETQGISNNRWGDAGKWPWSGRAGGGITMNGTASSRWSSRGFRMSPVRNGKTRCLLRYEAKDASEK